MPDSLCVCMGGFPENKWDLTKLPPSGWHLHRLTETVSKTKSFWAQRLLAEALYGLLIYSRNWQSHLQWDFSSPFFPGSLKFPETKPFKSLLNELREWIKTPNGKCCVGTASAACGNRTIQMLSGLVLWLWNSASLTVRLTYLGNARWTGSLATELFEIACCWGWPGDSGVSTV